MVALPYVIETAARTHISKQGFTPKRKVAFLIQGQGGNHNASFHSITELLIMRGYDYITACRNAGPGAFCRDISSVTKRNILGKIEPAFSSVRKKIDMLKRQIIEKLKGQAQKQEQLRPGFAH